MLAFQAYPPPFPREGVTKLLDNARVVAWHVQWAKARPTPMHEHTLDLVGIVLEGGHAKVTLPDGTVRVGQPSERGNVVFQPRGVIHVEESLVAAGRTIGIELKDVPSPVRARAAGAVEAFPREGARLVLENDRVALWDYQWVASRPVALHAHSRDTVVVPIDAGDVTVEFQSGEVRVTRLVPGEVLFFSQAEPHREAATAGSPRAIVVELK
jgi:quercetin dioxygenase-like cupin family protein